MSRLDDLIAELCPDGVEYKTIEHVCTKISSGGTPNTSQGEYYGADIPWLRTQEVDWINILDTGVKITEEGLKNSSAKWIPKNCVIVAMYGATAAKVAINKIPLTTNQACCNLQVDKTKAMYRYVYYWLANKYNDLKERGQGSQSNINAKIIRSFPIPVPPLPIQQEIVRILDNFTELTAELTAELETRKKQYAYYRDEQLTFGDDVEWKPLGEEFPFIRNGFVGTVTPFFTDKENGIRYLQGTNIHNGVISDDVVYYVSKDFHEKHIRTKLKQDDILMVQSGHVGECAVVGEKYKGANCHALIVMSNKGNCDSRFIAYYFQSAEGKKKLKKITTGGTVKHILASKMKQFVIPVPPIQKQHKIVELLDRFDTLVNDITAGLPAEIEARRKQYEYYRDQLLTFPRSHGEEQGDEAIQ